MTFIDTVPEQAAPPALAGHYAADRAAGGEVRNYTRAFSHRPDVYGAWRELSATLQSGMDPRRYAALEPAFRDALTVGRPIAAS